MLHIIKQYKKLILSFLESNLNNPLDWAQINAMDKATLKPSIDDIVNTALKDKKLTSEERIKISLKYKEYILWRATIKEETKNDLKSYLEKSQWWKDFEIFKKHMLDKLSNSVTATEPFAKVEQVTATTLKSDKLNVISIITETAKNVIAWSESLSVDYLTLLSDLNSDSDLDDKNIIDEKDLKTTLSKLSNWGDTAKLLDIYKNVMWESIKEINKDNVSKFHEKLINTIKFIQLLGINSWLYTILSWNTQYFANEVMKLPKENRKIEISNFDKLSPWVQNTLWALVSAWVLILTQWVVAVSREDAQYNSDDFISKVEKAKSWEPLSKLQSILTYIKDAFTGRRLSFSIWEDDVINVEKFENDITNFATWVLELKFDENDNLPNWLSQDTYNETLKLAKEFWLYEKKPEDKKTIQWIMIKSYILNEWNKRQWVDYKVTIGLLFIWLHRDSIWVETVATKLNKDQANVERKLTKRTLDSKLLESTWISVNKLNYDNFEHNLPEKGKLIKLPWDDRAFPIKEINLPDGVTLDDLKNSNKKYDFNFSFVGWRENNYYELNLVESTSTTALATWSVGPKQWIDDVKNIRTWKNLNKVRVNEKLKESIKFWEALYLVWHKVEFSELVKSISSWDKESARTWLNEYKWNYKTIVKSMLSKIDTSFNEWDSYMSWNNDTRKQKSPKFEKVRKLDVISAEKALANKSWFPEPSNESSFKVEWNYSSKQISEVLSGQEITSVQFMTPVDGNDIRWSRSALHRVSVVDGSFAISEKSQIVNEATRKQAIVEWLLNSSDSSRAIVNQLSKLNKFLGNRWNVNLPNYKTYLVSWKIEDLWVKWLKLQDWKETRFLEARAMVAWNICLNATYAIAYPAFELNWVKQNVDSVLTSDATATTNYSVVEWVESWIWLNPIAAALLKSNWWKPSWGNSTESTTPDWTGGQIPGGAPNNVASPTWQVWSNSAVASGGGGFKLPK